MSLKKAMGWRYATKAYNKDKQLDPEQWLDLQTSVQLSPSSYGLQPYQLIVIEDLATREQISQAAYLQPQIITASKLIVIAVYTDISKETVRKYIDHSAFIRNTERVNLKKREEFINSRIEPLTYEQKIEWAEKQAYLAAGVLIAAAAEAGVDATPMEGFNSQKIDEILKLKEKSLKATLLFALGFRSPEDPFASLPKVRKTKEELFITI